MVSDGRQAKARQVEVGVSNARESVITNGLKPGDELIVSGQSQALDGAPIRVMK